MKKLLCVLAVLLLILPSALAEDESIYVGAWAKVQSTDSGGALFEVFYLTENHKVFHFVQNYSAAKPQFGSQAVGLWFPKWTGIHIIYGDNQECDAEFIDENYLGFRYGTMIYAYGKIPDFMAVNVGDLQKVTENGQISQAYVDNLIGIYSGYSMDKVNAIFMASQQVKFLKEAQAEGYTLSQGEYLVGWHIPAGRYIINAGKSRNVTVYVYDEKGYYPDSYYIGSAYNEYQTIVNLKTGYTLKITGGTVNIKESGNFSR